MGIFGSSGEWATDFKRVGASVSVEAIGSAGFAGAGGAVGGSSDPWCSAKRSKASTTEDHRGDVDLFSPCTVFQLPDNLAHHAQEKFGIVGFEVEAHHEPACFFLEHGVGAGLDIAADAEGFEQSLDDLLALAGGCAFNFLRRVRERRAARQFVEADGDGLPQVHRDIFFPGWNVQ